MPQSTIHSRSALAAAAVTTKQPRQRADPCADPCLPVCPACGGLQCLCRPRFFPGQLLTDEDLNRLERYVVEKNRLHNRYLVGWGVACGLEVVCDACDSDHVVVRTGYALSPCGDDIIVCRDASVNICELIARCRPQVDPYCDPAVQPPPRDCRGASPDWVLAICYDERPSRGITALLGSSDDACCSKCGCGGSGSCDCGKIGSGGCGCGAPSGAGCTCNGASSRSTATSSKRKYAPQCEPTQICEGYRFIAYPAPTPQTTFFPNPGLDNANPGTSTNFGSDLFWAWLYANRSRFGPLLDRLLCCVVRALELRNSIREGKAIDGALGPVIWVDYATALRDFTADFAQHRCAFVSEAAKQYTDATSFVRKIGNVTTPLAKAQLTELNDGLRQTDATWLNVVAECLCSALLPACPGPEPKNCVPLAVVTLADNPCRVVEICNWEERKILVTWRTILYWLSWLPWQKLRAWISALCCGDRRDREAYEWLKLIVGVAVAGMSTSTQATTPSMATKSMTTKVMPTRAARKASSAASAPDPLTAAMNAPNLFKHLAGEFEQLRAGTDANAPMWATLAARLTNGSALASLAGPAAVTSEEQSTLAALQARVNGLAEQIEVLRAQIAKPR